MRLSLYIGALALTVATCCSAQQKCLAPSATAHSRTPALALAGRVTDAANVLSAQQRVTLSRELEQFEQRTKHQLVIVTVPSLGGQNEADFARDLGNSWGIGRKCYNDGIILLIAPNDRRVRIAVGRGLETTLTHAVSQQIIDKQILPAFRRGDLPRGIEAGTRALIAAAK